VQVLKLLERIDAELADELVGFDATALHPEDAARILDATVRAERRLVAVRTLVSATAARSSSFTRSGHRSAEEWLAQKTGTSYGEARDTLAASEKLEELPAVTEALRRGELSAPQLAALGPAATPENEARLLASSKQDGFGGFRKTCAKEKAAARSSDDEARRAARIHRERYHRSWTDAEGAYRYEGSCTAAEGAARDAAIAAEAERIFKQAHAEGRRESSANYRSDALHSLITGGGARVETEMVIRVDEARLRGDEGVCETSTGTVPVEEAIGAILAGAFVKVVATNGIDVTRVVHAGRKLPAELRTAIVERDGYRCVRPGCDSAHRLEVHHYCVDFAKGGPTSYANLATLCSHDHDLVTYGGHRLAGAPGRWEWINPP
jgi:hypothetical protein